MRSVTVLAALADRLNREAGRPSIPSLYFVTDPKRTPEPLRFAARLPRGAAVIYRHFGAADREKVARALAALCRRRGLKLLIGADPALARKIGADGVHWPERMAPRGRWRLQTQAAHSGRALAKAAARGMDAALLAPVLPSGSASAARPLGVFRASALVRPAVLPVIALGGVNARAGKRLLGCGFAGLAAVDGLADARSGTPTQF